MFRVIDTPGLRETHLTAEALLVLLCISSRALPPDNGLKCEGNCVRSVKCRNDDMFELQQYKIIKNLRPPELHPPELLLNDLGLRQNNIVFK